MIANPETGEVYRVETGESVFFRKDTWHHGFSYGAEPVRVLEFFAPPPSTGTSGPYARTKEYLPEERWSYADDALVGAFSGGRAGRGDDARRSAEPTARTGSKATRSSG